MVLFILICSFPDREIVLLHIVIQECSSFPFCGSNVFHIFIVIRINPSKRKENGGVERIHITSVFFFLARIQSHRTSLPQEMLGNNSNCLPIMNTDFGKQSLPQLLDLAFNSSVYLCHLAVSFFLL